MLERRFKNFSQVNVNTKTILKLFCACRIIHLILNDVITLRLHTIKYGLVEIWYQSLLFVFRIIYPKSTNLFLQLARCRNHY